MKLLFVVHRFYPYLGGSELATWWIARECLARGHTVYVYTDTHKGDIGGIQVTSSKDILATKFDLVFVHGADCSSQNYVHNCKLNSPILYQICLPSESASALLGMRNAQFLGWSTTFDLDHIHKLGYAHKAIYIPYGIPEDRLGKPGFKKKYGINSRIFMSAGGFWQHKGMVELADAFTEFGSKKDVLCLFGYALPEKAPKTTRNIKIFNASNAEELLSALSESQAYIMNSTQEGFGLVLLEAMLNKVPWVARPVGGASDMRQYGMIYHDIKSMIQLITNSEQKIYSDTEASYQYVNREHMIRNTVNNIEQVLGVKK